MSRHEYDEASAAYDILRNRRVLIDSGHQRAVDWAGAYVDMLNRGWRITLTPEEMKQGIIVAKDRVDRGKDLDDQRWSLDSYKAHLTGAYGEIAVGRWLGLPLNNVRLPRDYRGEKPPDLGKRTEVRASTWGRVLKVGMPHAGGPSRDRRSWRYWLVTGKAPELLIRGWIEGVDVLPRHKVGSHYEIPHVELNLKMPEGDH